ncbi:MAG: secondary thiamine-phosphate synthase enzyme YjbQ [Conexivisphaerales archaeon]
MIDIETIGLEFETSKEGEILDITDNINQALLQSHMKEGMAGIFVQGSTAALAVIEYEQGLLLDFYSMLERVAPKDIVYQHEKAYHDGNGHSHVRASLLGPSLNIPFIDSKLALGTWQRVTLLELDIRPRKRSVILQLIGK